MGLALPSSVNHRHAHARPNLTSGPFVCNDATRHTCSRTVRSTDAIRKCAHRVPNWLMCAHAALHSGTFHSAGPFPAPHSAPLRCPRAIATRPSRPLHGPRLGAPICGESAPACQHSPCSCHRSLTPGSASGVLFARAAWCDHPAPPTTLPTFRSTRTLATCSSYPPISPEASAAG